MFCLSVCPLFSVMCVASAVYSFYRAVWCSGCEWTEEAAAEGCLFHILLESKQFAQSWVFIAALKGYTPKQSQKSAFIESDKVQWMVEMSIMAHTFEQTLVEGFHAVKLSCSHMKWALCKEWEERRREKWPGCFLCSSGLQIFCPLTAVQHFCYTAQMMAVSCIYKLCIKVHFANLKSHVIWFGRSSHETLVLKFWHRVCFMEVEVTTAQKLQLGERRRSIESKTVFLYQAANICFSAVVSTLDIRGTAAFLALASFYIHLYSSTWQQESL